MLILERKKNAVRNIKVGMVNRLVTVIVPFILRTVIIYTLGTKYLGLSSLFTSVLQVLSLSELGIGNAMVYSLYYPIAKDNKEQVCALVSLYKIIYRIIGMIILIGGIIVMPFIKNFIHGDYPNDINIYILYLIYVINSALTYFISAYKSVLISAHQRRDVFSGIGVIIHLILYATQIICLLFFKNYYTYVIWLPIFTCIETVCLSRYVDKNYPQFTKKSKINKDDLKMILSQVKDLFGHKLSQVITNSVDTIVISSFIGLQMVTIYNNYFYLMSAVSGTLDIIYTSVLAGIGNSIVSENEEKNENDFWMLSYINCWIIGWCTICFLCLYQPMMTLWMGEELLLNFDSVILLCIYFYVWKIRQSILVYKDAAGLWHADRLRPYIEIVMNLTVNIILVKIIGINGVIISTIVSMLLVSIPWETHVFFGKFLKKGEREYYKFNFIFLIIIVILAVVTYMVCNMVRLNNLITLIMRAVICVFVPNLLLLLVGFNNNQVQKVLTLLLASTRLEKALRRLQK